MAIGKFKFLATYFIFPLSSNVISEKKINMKLAFNQKSVLATLALLENADRQLNIFGANCHKYKLNPPLDESFVEDIENQYSVQLPEDYRHFITKIGNGGAGPAYGVFKFGEHDDGHGVQKWGNGYLVGNLGNSFPHIILWNHSEEFWSKRPDIDDDMTEEEQDRLWEEWEKMLEAEYWTSSIVDGAIPICHLGCATRQWLVINGPQYSYIWNDHRADDSGLSPLLNNVGKQMTFTDWYLGWLHITMVKLKIL